MSVGEFVRIKNDKRLVKEAFRTAGIVYSQMIDESVGNFGRVMSIDKDKSLRIRCCHQVLHYAADAVESYATKIADKNDQIELLAVPCNNPNQRDSLMISLNLLEDTEHNYCLINATNIMKNLLTQPFGTDTYEMLDYDGLLEENENISRAVAELEKDHPNLIGSISLNKTAFRSFNNLRIVINPENQKTCNDLSIHNIKGYIRFLSPLINGSLHIEKSDKNTVKERIPKTLQDRKSIEIEIFTSSPRDLKLSFDVTYSNIWKRVTHIAYLKCVDLNNEPCDPKKPHDVFYPAYINCPLDMRKICGKRSHVSRTLVDVFSHAEPELMEILRYRLINARFR